MPPGIWLKVQKNCPDQKTLQHISVVVTHRPWAVLHCKISSKVYVWIYKSFWGGVLEDIIFFGFSIYTAMSKKTITKQTRKGTSISLWLYNSNVEHIQYEKMAFACSWYCVLKATGHIFQEWQARITTVVRLSYCSNNLMLLMLIV